MLRSTLAAAAAAVLLLAAGPAAAQRKPDPQPKEREDSYAIDYEQFREAYQVRNEPTVLVLCGWSTGLHQPQPPGVGLFNLDTSGITFQLKSAFEQLINDPEVDLDLINLTALQSASRRLSNVLEASREREAVELLANELDAELVLLIRFLDYDPESGTPNRLTFEALDLARGRTLSTFPFQWELGSSTQDIKKYARAIAARFTSDYAKRARSTQRFTVRALGLENDPRLLHQVRRVIESVPGIYRVRPRGAGTVTDPNTGRSDSLTQFEVRYDDDFMWLASELAIALEDADGLTSETVDMVGTTITLRISKVEEPVAAETVAGCEELILLRTPAGEAQRRKLKDAYDAKDAPSIAVMVNRTPTRREREAIGEPSTGRISSATVVIVQVAGDDVLRPPGSTGPDRPAGDDEAVQLSFIELQTNLVEEALYNRLGGNLLGFTRIDPATARRRLVAAIDEQRSVFGEDELVEIMRRQKIADIIILGKGTTFADTDGSYSATYTFRAVNTADSQILGTATARGELGRSNMKEVVGRMADDVIKALACEMLQFWQPPSQLQVTIKNAETDRDFEDFSRVIRQRAAQGAPLRIIGRPSFEGGQGQGVIKLALDYSCSFEELIGEFREASRELPFDLTVERLDRSEALLAIRRR